MPASAQSNADRRRRISDLIQTYDSEAKCLAERDRRTAVHVSQGMQQTNQPGLAISNLGVSAANSTYFAYRCVPAGIRPP